MKIRYSIIGMVSVMIMSINIIAEDIFTGNIRLGYQQHETSDEIQNASALAVMLHAQSPSYYGVEIGGTLHSSSGNTQTDFQGVPFFDVNNENYAIISEAYLKGSFMQTQVIVGRQSLETPFADSDDIGMIPNTFEAITLVNNTIKDTSIFLAQVQKMSGVDSPYPSQFTSLNDDNGVQILGLTYRGIRDTSLAGWFYNIQGEGSIGYIEASYEKEDTLYSYAGMAQYVLQNYDVGEDSRVYGVSASFGIKKIGLTSTLSYNKTQGREAENFFGGGAFVTNAEHNTLKESGIDGNTILLTLAWEASSIRVEGLSFVMNIDGHHGKRKDFNEYDFSIDYAYSDSMHLTAIYSDVNDVESFQNLRIFVNYSF